MKKRANLIVLLCLIALVSVGIAIRSKNETPKSTPKPRVAKTPWSLLSSSLDADHQICSHNGYDSKLEYYAELPAQSAERYFLRGLGYASREQWEKAEENYRQALSRTPDDIPALFHLAEAEFETGRYKEAIQTLTRVVDVGPTYYQAYGELSICQQRLGLNEESGKNWTIYRQVQARTEYEYNHLAKMQYERGQFKESWHTANEGLTVGPDLSVLNANRAKAMIALGHKETAMLDLNRAIEDGPYWVSYYRARIEASGNDPQSKADKETIAQLQSEVLP